MKATTGVQLEHPRGIRTFTESARIRPHACQWRIDGKRRTKFFPTAELRDAFAKTLAGDIKQGGLAALRFDPDEVLAWRAFRAQLPAHVTLDQVIDCWHRHGVDRPPLPVEHAAKNFLTAKKAEGVGAASISHYKNVFASFATAMKGADAASVKREDIAVWLAKMPGADWTRRTHGVRVRSLFRWLKVNRMIPENPCEGLKPLRIVQGEVQILTVEQAAKLFAENIEEREVCGRLALEAFAGLRFSSAGKVVAGDIDFAAKGLTLPAAKIKTRRRHYIDGLPDNFWAWLEWSKPDEWTFTEREWLYEKGRAFVRAKVKGPHNCLRHSFATFHVAKFKDVSRTAAILCHSSPKMLFQHYKGRATEADGGRFFEIRPAPTT